MGLTRDRRGFAVLLRYTSGATLARMADEGARVALVLFATSGHGGAAFGGLLVAGLMVPHIVAAPLAGRLADGVRRRRPLYTAALLVYAGTLIGAAVSVPISRLLTFGLVVLAGCVAPLMIGGLTSLIGEILPEHSSRAYGWDSATYGLAGIAGPALAAIVAGVLDATWSLIALGGVAVLASVLVGGLPIPERLPPGPGGRPAKVPLSAAVTVLWRRRRLGAVTVGSTMNVLGLGALPLVAVLLAGRVENPMLTGWLMSAAALGGLVGSLLYTRYPIGERHPEATLLVSLAATAVPIVLVPLVDAVWPMLALFVLMGLCNGPMFCSLLVVRDREAPAEVRTQVFTIGAGLRSTAAAAGAAAAGALAGAGVTPLLLGVAACQLGGALLGGLVLRRPTTVPSVGTWRSS